MEEKRKSEEVTEGGEEENRSLGLNVQTTFKCSKHFRLSNAVITSRDTG